MKIYTLIFDTSGNGIYTQSFKTKNKALTYLKDWDNNLNMKEIIEEIKVEGYYHDDDDKHAFSIILEESEVL